MKRTYTKRDEGYWENRKKGVAAAPITINTGPQNVTPAETVPFPEIAYASAGSNSGDVSVRNQQVNNGGVGANAFQNIRALALPYGNYNGTREYAGMGDAVELCTRAWAGIAAVRNAIEISVEFSSQPLYIKCDNTTVLTFFQEWFKAVGMNKLKRQFFREYYRSGNVFLYKFEGKFGPAYYKNYQKSFGGKGKNNRVPIRYELLAPSNIFVPTGMAANNSYVRLLSTYDLQRLAKPLTEQDRQVYNSLPDQVKEQIKTSTNYPLGVYIPLDPNRLRFAFYKKQSYEPLAVPMVWPVLPDVEWKLTLQKIDKSLIQTVENVILLVTTGEAPNQWNGGNGINQRNIARLQAMLTNQAISRVIVGDYTTKASWVEPNLTALDPKKYEIVNENIKEGLQSLLTGEDKFANAQIKSRIFIERLEEGQEAFLEFLMLEIEQICEDMGFRTVPEVGFRKINLSDEGVMSRVVAQLGQLGILTAPQVVQTLETGVYPNEKEMEIAQTKYVKDREDGKYLPLVGGTQKEDGSEGAGGAGGRPPGTGVKKVSSKPGPIGTSKGSISMKAMIETLRDSSNLEVAVAAELKRKFKVKELNAAQMNAAHVLTRNIMAAHPKDAWLKSVKKSVEQPPMISQAVAAELDLIQEEFALTDMFEAALLRVSRL